MIRPITLILAAMHNNSDVVRVLIGAGADINEHDKSGFTALMWASFAENIDVVQYLLEQGEC